MADLGEAVLPGGQLAELFVGQHPRHREAAAEGLAQHDDVGLHAVVLHGEELTAAAPCGLHLIDDHRRALAGADLADLLQVALR